MAKLPARYNAVALPLVLSFLMTFLVSGLSMLIAVGLRAGFLFLWMKAWAFSWLIAFPVMVLVLPLARRTVGGFVEPPGPAARVSPDGRPG